MKSLTRRQSKILEYIKTYIAEHKYPPTMREVSVEFSISVKGAYDHIKALEKKNYIQLNHHRSRTIEVLEDGESSEDDSVAEIPMLGNVAAGQPLFAEENHEGDIRVPQEYLKRGVRHFALHIQGDSMSGAGIFDGDLGVFAHQNVADNGDIVVAMVDDAVTLKRFYKESTRVQLRAENPEYPSIYTQDVRILGKLTHLIRSYV